MQFRPSPHSILDGQFIYIEEEVATCSPADHVERVLFRLRTDHRLNILNKKKRSEGMIYATFQELSRNQIS